MRKTLTSLMTWVSKRLLDIPSRSKKTMTPVPIPVTNRMSRPPGKRFLPMALVLLSSLVLSSKSFATTMITGTLSVCPGATSSLMASNPGGTWSSSNTGIASIGSATGVVSGVGSGTATITYTEMGGTTTAVVTVMALPSVIGGTTKACPGTSATLTDATSGGAWSSNDIDIATIGSSSGIFTGVTAGTVTMTYTATTGCYRTTLVTINPTPSAISGTASVCIGSTTALTDATTPGLSWSSSTTSVATVNSSSGIVTGVAAGTSRITYTVVTGCYITTVVTVNALPSAISGTLKACPGTSTTLTDDDNMGTWSSSNISIATAGSSTGIITGVAAGTSTITYTDVNGCRRTGIVTINATPSAITGTANACVGTTTSLSNFAGTWTSGDIMIATVGSTTGVVTGQGAGTTGITYTNSNGCSTNRVVTITAFPSASTGTAIICSGSTTTLMNGLSGGTWVSGNGGIATVGSATGVVTGVGAGTVNISYTFGGTCYVNKVVTVSALPATITGTLLICNGAVTTLSSSSGSGTWSSSNMTVGTIGSISSVSGRFVSLSTGTSTVSYTNAAGCARSVVVTVDPTPDAGSITGTLSVCVGAVTSLDNMTTGGSWTSSSTGVATVGSANGAVTGVAAGTATITYTVTASCGSNRTTAVVTVNPIASSSISGTATVCTGFNTTLTNSISGGSWTSDDGAVASVGSSNGVVTGVGAGTTTISYEVMTTCGTLTATKVVTVNASASAGTIMGTLTVCTGATTSLTNGVSGGTWTSSTTSVAAIGTNGVVTGVAAGTSTISYSKSNGCGTVVTTAIVSVNASPASITGTAKACPTATATLADATMGGTWSSGDDAIATVGTNGVVTGVMAGTISIYYTINGCAKSVVFTVNPIPAAIGGTTTVCIGSTTNLTDASSGGTSWTSSNTSVATVNASSGVVTGVMAGTSNVTYTVNTGCYISTVVSVHPTPSAISGASATCPGTSYTLTDASGMGTWVSSSTSIATVGSSSGIVSALATGTSSITYTNGTTGCTRTAVVTVNTAPPAMTGTFSACVGATTTLFDVGGGTWSSGDETVATVGTSSGVVSGVATGTAGITYTLGGCTSTSVVTVSAGPTAITGTAVVCAGNTTTLASTPMSGSWSGNNNAIATVGSSTGVVTGVSGTATMTVTYSLGGTCVVTKVVTVNGVPGAISGTLTVCEGGATTLTNSSGTGTWSSSNMTAGTIGSISTVSARFAGLAAGTSTVSYTFATGCARTVVVTVSAAPDAGSITGTASVCAGSNTTLMDMASGGVWSSSNTSVGTVGTSGAVTGIMAGTTTISYTVTSSCGSAVATTVVTVNPSSGASITGTATVCAGSMTTLANALTGGTWSSDDGAIATVGSMTGVVTGVSAGTTTISYEVVASCGTFTATQVVTVNAAPDAGSITGTAIVCTGSTTTLMDAAGGGVWSSSNTGIATVGTSGVVTGVVAGTATISYTVTVGCGSLSATKVVTVNTAPSVGTLSGAATVNVGSTITLSSTVSGGTWTASNSNATVVGSTGVVTGAMVGTVVITYTVTNSCGSATGTRIVTVLAATPGSITGTLSVCVGSTTTLACAPSGGTWYSSNSLVAGIGTNGVVTGGTAGTSTISYTSGGVTTTAVVTVNALPNNITGTASVCVNSTTTLADGTSGGTWSSSNMTNGTIGTNGVLSGLVAGTTTISYTLSTGCARSVTATVYAVPDPISGAGSTCIGSTLTLTDAGGGVWSSSATSTISVGSSSGVVTALAAGNATVTYTISGNCRVTAVVSVNSSPAVITGTLRACPGTTTTLNDATGGGTWSASGGGAVATIGSTDGILSGVATGTAIVTYTAGTACSRTTVITINPNPAAIAGTTTVCIGATSVLTDPTSGGLSWSSSNTGIATIGATSGLLKGISGGAANITFTLGTGCYTVTAVSVNAATPSITGTLSVCPGYGTTLANSSMGGTWTSANTAVGTIGSSSGILTGVVAGTSTISYTTTGGCVTTSIATVSASPVAISGTATACVGSNTTLTCVGSGSWSTGDMAIATVGSATGIVTGAGAGTVAITFSNGGGCTSAKVVTVSAAPAAIMGTFTVCAGSTVTLTNAVTGGTWSSSNNAILSTSGTTGIVTGVGASTARVTYTVGANCTATQMMTVNARPNAITGSTSVCEGSAITLVNSSGPGTWSSTSMTVGTIGSISSVHGRLVGIDNGTTTVSYTFANGCAATTVVTVNNTPNAGTLTSMTGYALQTISSPTLTLTSDGDAGGTWASSNTSVATVGTDGVVTGLMAGTSNISYTVTSGSCSATATHTVSVIVARPGGNNGIANNNDVINIFPNPNNGDFFIKGALSSVEDGSVVVEITDMLGQVVYSNTLTVRDGNVDEHLSIGKNLANGMYLLNVKKGNTSSIFRFMLQQ